MSRSISNKEEFAAIMECLRKMPERSDHITAYGAGPDPEEDEDIDALGDFAEAILEDEYLKSLQDDIVNVYYQLFSIDFQRCYEGIATFYENFYKDNTKENVLRACKWMKQNGHEQMAIVIEAGYDSEEKQKVTAQWIDAHTEEIYDTYRTLMFLFEDKYLGGEYDGIQTYDN